jgi:putative membrane protein
MKTDTVIREATFNEKVCTYWLLSTTVVLIITIVGIPFLLIWLPLGFYFTKRYLARIQCVLTEKDLKVKKGIFVRVEKTIPLEKITDLGMVQGPIMRHFGIHQLTVETAGQSGTGGPLVSLTGVNDVEDFREAVLQQRDQMRGIKPARPAEAQPVAPTGDQTVLKEIHETLLRIEEQLKKQ